MTIEQMQDILFEMICTVDDICGKEGLSYTLGGGSLLGAVRHHGFIPWDDDMDLCLWHKDYPRFRDAMRENLPGYYRLVEPEEVSPLFFDFVPRIEDMRYLCRKESETDKAYKNLQNHPSIDLFLMDYVSNTSMVAAWKGFEKKVIYGFGMAHRAFSRPERYTFIEHAQAIVLSTVGKCFSLSTIHRMWENSCPKTDVRTSYSMVSNDLPRYLSATYKSEWFEESIRIPFRDRMLPVPVGYHEKLKLQYGDYMSIPSDRSGYEVHI